MGKFLESEKPKQAAFKIRSASISCGAAEDGIYKKHYYGYCLQQQYAYENLFPGIRASILAYFAKNSIKWHDGQDGNPSNHMCDSQVCCANFLFPFSDKPAALATLLRPFFPTLQTMLPVEDGHFVAFEWIGKENYLGEIKSANSVRTRGANFTSADAAVRFQHQDGCIQFVLIEWKYTELYYGTSLAVAKSGRKRTKIYQPLFDEEDCPLDKSRLPAYTDLFYEPFYQLMRQQFLANEMEKAHESDADIVSLLHISPAHNTDFCRITSPGLQVLGTSPIDVWNKLAKDPDRFLGVHSEAMFGNFNTTAHPELKEWYGYISSRYHWVNE